MSSLGIVKINKLISRTLPLSSMDKQPDSPPQTNTIVEPEFAGWSGFSNKHHFDILIAYLHFWGNHPTKCLPMHINLK